LFNFWKKHGEKSETHSKHLIIKSGRDLLKDAEAGLDSEWFNPKHYSILKELENTDKGKSLVDDKSKDNVIASIINSLESAADSFVSENDLEGLKSTASMLLKAYVKMGRLILLDR